MSRAGRLAALACLAAGAAVPPETASQDAVTPSWQHVVEWMRAEHVRITGDLERARTTLRGRARAESPALLARLEAAPPPPPAPGYGVLPPVGPDGPAAPVVSSEQRFSLEVASTAYAATARDAAVLARRAEAEPGAPLGPLVDEYERLRASAANMASHVSYHAHWQRNVGNNLAFYAERNAAVAVVREWLAASAAGDEAGAAAARARLEERLGTFRPAEGPRVERRSDGGSVLPVRVLTDIEDERFLQDFRAGVEASWSDSEAAVRSGLRIELAIERVEPAALYPDGAPARGTPIDVAGHLARFPEGARVLTTGAESTFADVGRAIVLGPGAVTGRTFAHEFGHLLGFDDTYLRGYEGDPGDPFGVVLVEWSGLTPDIMSAPGYGVVTVEMMERLLAAYAPS